MPLRFARPCLSCGVLETNGERCAECEEAYWQAAYGGSWRRLSATARAKARRCSCAGCSLHDGPCLSTERLTLDHTVPVARGGTVQTGTAVLCQRCNSAKRDR